MLIENTGRMTSILETEVGPLNLSAQTGWKNVSWANKAFVHENTEMDLQELLEELLESFWRALEELLESFWRGLEELLESFWRALEELLESSWRASRELLEGFWIPL